MIVSDTHRFAFVHIPKSAGTTVRFALMGYDERRKRYYDKGRCDHPTRGALDHAHLPLALVKALHPDDFERLIEFRSFALIRDPMSRFASSLHEYLHWMGEKPLSDLTPDQRAVAVARVIAKLESLPDDQPITDPTLIHFSRQSDYIELDGKQVITDVYSTEDLLAMMAAIEELIGTELPVFSKNERVSYPFPALRSVSEWAQRQLGSALPLSISRPILRGAREMLVAAGVVSMDRTVKFANMFDAETEAFVKAFYARDFAIHESLIQAAEKRA